MPCAAISPNASATMPYKGSEPLRRLLALAACLLPVALVLAGCRPLVVDDIEALSVYATFYPIYALTDAVMEGVPDAELHCLVQPQDGCLRNYQLSDWDAALLASGADAVMLGGRGLESFEDALFDWGDDGPAVSAILYNLELYDAGTTGDGEAESHFKGINPHLYMSLEGARQMIASIAAMLQSMDPRYAEAYAENAKKADAALAAAQSDARGVLEGCVGRRVAVLNEALVYPARDYGLEIAKALERESGDGMSGEALERCIEGLSGAEIDAVLIEKQAPQAFVEAIASAGFEVALMDVMSTHAEGEGFDAYLQIQAANARAVAEALARAAAGKDSY